ncbi:MAG: tyrosine-type recombinase/integrase [Acidimicrobiales bacterium]
MKAARHWAPTSVNQALAAIDNLYRSLNQRAPDVAREDLPQVAPRALDDAEQRALLRSIERCPSARDRAIATVFLYTALRLSELAALDLADVSMSARRGRVKVRLGKGDAYREVPLNTATRTALDEWLAARARQVERTERAHDAAALWLSRSGGRLSARAIEGYSQDKAERFIGAALRSRIDHRGEADTG